MQVIIVKDGTVPVAVATVVGTDMDDDTTVGDYLDENEVDSGIVAAYEVEPGSTALYVQWTDSMGFEVFGHPTLDGALKQLFDDPSVEPGQATVVEPGRHWAITYNPVEEGDEAYDEDDDAFGHVFAL